MECKACKKYIEEANKIPGEYAIDDPAVEYRLHDLMINRDIDCTCGQGEIKKREMRLC